MKNKFLSLILFAVLFLMGCYATNSSSTSKSFDVYGSGVIQKPVIVDLEVKEQKVVGSSVGTTTGSLESLKQEAIADAIKQASCDVLIEPNFFISTKGSVRTVTVSGFPGIYKNFRNLKDTTDLKLLQAGVLQKANTYQPAPETKKKGKGIGWAILGIAGLITVLVLAGN